MSDHPLLNGSGTAQDARATGVAHLPARSSYVEVHPRVVFAGGGSGLLEYWYLLRRRKGALVLIAFAGLLAGVLLTLLQTPVYQAHTTLEIQNLNDNFLNMRDVSPTAPEGGSAPIQADVQTQINILQSESVVKQVIAKLDLATRLPAIRGKSAIAVWRKTLRLPEPLAAASEDSLLRQVMANLKVRARANTRLVEVLYDSPDPALAAAIANSVTAEFTRVNLESHWQTAQQTGNWLKQQMEGVRINLEQSEEELQTYARQAGLLVTAEKDNVADEKLRQLQQELSKAQADRVIHQSKEELVAKTSADSLPEVLDDAILKEYQVKLTDLRRQLAELSSGLTQIHPAVKKVEAQIATLEAAREMELTNVTHRIQNEFESAQRRERLLAISYDAQARVVTEQAARMTHYNILKREVDNNRQLYDSMLQHVKEASIASALRATNVRVVDPARPPARPYKPNVLLNALLGFCVGSFVGIAFVVVRERSDNSIRTPGEASWLLDVPELGVIPAAEAERSLYFAPYLQTGGAGARKANVGQNGLAEMANWKKKPSALADSFRSTMASILWSGENGNRPRVIALTSANPQEGKTTVASNLGLALAEIGQRVLLIDGDLRKPRLHVIFDVPNQWGFSDVLEGTKPQDTTEGMVVESGFPNLLLMTAGTATGSISSLLHSPRALELLKQMRRDFDMVIIDMPPVLQMPDARILGRLADGVILVVRSTRTTKENAAKASRRLMEDGARMLGTVLNDWDCRKPGNAAYEYGSRPYHYEENRPN